MRKATAKDFQNFMEILKIMLFSFASLLSGTGRLFVNLHGEGFN
jgi:hypothetical protein